MHDRLDGFVLTAEPGLVLDEAAVEDAALLMGLAQPSALDPQSLEDYEFHQTAIGLIAWLHWFRTALQPLEEGGHDARMAGRLFMTIAEHNRDAVPRSLASHIDVSHSAAATPAYQRAPSGRRGDVAYHVWETTGRAEALDRAVAAYQRAVEEAAEQGEAGTPGHSLDLTRLCMVLRTRSELFGTERDAQSAVEAGRRSVDGEFASTAHQLVCLHHLALAIAHRGMLCEDRHDLDEAIQVRRDAVAQVDESDRDALSDNSSGMAVQDILPFLYDGLGTALLHRHWSSPSLDDLHEAVEAARRAVGLMTEPDAGFLLNLCLVLTERSELTDDDNDLDEALTVGQLAVAAAPVGDHRRPRALHNLSLARMLRCRRTGSRSDLDDVVRLSELAVEASADDAFNSARRRIHLAQLLAWRFDLCGNLADIDRVVELLRHAVQVTPWGHPGRSDVRHRLVDALKRRYRATYQLEDLVEFMTIRREEAGTDRV
ncbi:hypothetical protein ACFYMI_03045 [Streptomyces collinus]|uniref:hypothetical protein n=1 Tax=Streptomyces collinus TaxID=42684 RepID=UPI00367AFAD2